MGATGTPVTAGGTTNGAATVEGSVAVSHKTKRLLTKTCTRMFTADLFTLPQLGSSQDVLRQVKG